MKGFFNIIAIFFIYIVFTSCQRAVELETLIRQMAIDNIIDKKDMERLEKESGLTCEALSDSINKIFAHTSKIQPTIIPCIELNKGASFSLFNAPKQNVNFYIENSASMLGYFESNSHFRASILAFSAFFKEKDYRLKHYFINEKVYPLDSHYIEKISVQEAKKYGNLSFSQLDKMLENILQNKNESKSNLDIFISDFVYDGKGLNPEQEQLNIQYKVRDIFFEREYGTDKSVLVLNMQSPFSGIYYDYKNGKTDLKNEPRPYYIWLMGNSEYLQVLYDAFDFQQLKGFKNKFLFFHQNKAKTSYYSILPNTQKLGNFRRAISSNNSKAVHDISQIKLDKKTSKMSFILSIDFAELPFPEKYLLDENNYKLKGNINATIRKIERLNQANIQKNDKRFLGTATHLVYIDLAEKILHSKDLELQLLYTYPAWEKYAIVDDTNIKTHIDKTFGIDAIMQGLQAAFHAENKIYATWEMHLHP